MSKAIMLEIKPGDRVDFVYEGVRMDGYVTCINHLSDGSVFYDVKCNGGMEFNRLTERNIVRVPAWDKYFFGGMDTDTASKFKTVPYDVTAMKDILNKCYGYLENDCKAVKEAFNNMFYGGYMDKKRSIKVYQTEIKSGERKGLYTTVIFRYLEPIVVKKDADAANDTLIAIAYAHAKHKSGSNSQFKKRIDEDTVKIGKDYVVNLWSDFFVPGEILKRKRWDIYTYVAVQDLFKRFSTKDIIDAINNVTYTVKEK